GKDPPVRIRGGGGEGQPEGCSGHRLRRSGERRERPAGGGAFAASPLRFGRVASRIRGDAERSRSTGSRPPAGVPPQRRADARTLPPRDDLTRGSQWIPWGPQAAGDPLQDRRSGGGGPAG